MLTADEAQALWQSRGRPQHRSFPNQPTGSSRGRGLASISSGLQMVGRLGVLYLEQKKKNNSAGRDLRNHLAHFTGGETEAKRGQGASSSKDTEPFWEL